MTKKTKVFYNACFCKFELSHTAIMRYAELKGLKIYPFVCCQNNEGSQYKLVTDAEAEAAFLVHYCTTPEYSDTSVWPAHKICEVRHDPILIQVIEELGDRAAGECAELKIVEIESGTLYRIEEDDDSESVVTQSSRKWTVAP